MIWEDIKINIKATNVDLTDEIHDYVVKKVTNLGKLLRKFQDQGAEVLVQFEVAKTTNHHLSGDKLFRADCNIAINGIGDFYAHQEEQDLFAAIDSVKDKLFSEIRRGKNKKEVLFRRGARSIKKMFRGLSKRNPFTSK